MEIAIPQGESIHSPDAIAREIIGSIKAMGGEVPTTEEEILAVFAAYDVAAKVTQMWDDDQLADFLGEFLVAWDAAKTPPEPSPPAADAAPE